LSETTGAGAHVGAGSASARRKQLRLVAYWSFALPVGWMIAVGIAHRVLAVRPEALLWTALFPVWLMFAAVAAYQLYTLATLHGPGLRGALALGGVWAAGFVLATAFSGIEAGTTVALALAIVLSAVHAEFVSIVEHLELGTTPARVGVYALLLAAGVSPVGLVAGAVMLSLGNSGFAPGMTALGFAAMVVAGVPLAAGALLSHKARRNAEAMLVRSHAEDSA